MMKIGRWEGNEIIYTIDVIGNSVNLIEDFDFAFDIIGATTIMTGMVVSEAAVPDMTIKISAGIAKDLTTEHFLIGEDLVATVTDSDPILDRSDIIEVRRLIEDTTLETRQFKDPITETISESLIDTKSEYKTEVKVLAGTPGSSAPAVETGWIKIAEIFVIAASITVVDGIIYNVDAEKAGVANTSWTNDTTVNYRNGTISEMTTKIIDNIAAILLNSTHRTSNGSDHDYLDQDVKAAASPGFAGITLGGGTSIGKLTISTSVPSGGSDGDIWLVREV